VIDAPTSFDPFGQPDSAVADHQPGYRAEATTAGLIHLRNRDYDPTTGQFLTPDPLDGVNGLTTVTNTHHYTNNDPINKTDPLGLRARDGSLALACMLGNGLCVWWYPSDHSYVDPLEVQSTLECLANFGTDRVKQSLQNAIMPHKMVVDGATDLWNALNTDTWGTLEAIIPIWGSVRQIDNSNNLCEEIIGASYLALDMATITLLASATPKATPGGPGAWRSANEWMSARASAYQGQIAGRSGSVYEVGGVKFDGFANGVLQEAKGPGYSNFIRNGNFQPWFRGADDLAAQAQRQVAAAGGTPIRWSVAEADAAAAIRNLLNQRGISGIDVVHVAPR
jgi:RHS repeat-associated protein